MKRKLKLQIQMSVDGFIAGPNGEMDWMNWDWGDEINNYVNKLLGSIDTIVLGRKLAEGFIPHWENVAANPNNPEVSSGKLFTDTPKIVFSKTLNDSKWKNTVIAKGDLAEEIRRLKNKNGKDIYACGGAEFVSNLIKESLIDELYLFINPVAIGKGLAIFDKLNQKQKLKLKHSQSFECGINVLVYTLDR